MRGIKKFKKSNFITRNKLRPQTNRSFYNLFSKITLRGTVVPLRQKLSIRNERKKYGQLYKGRFIKKKSKTIKKPRKIILRRKTFDGHQNETMSDELSNDIETEPLIEDVDTSESIEDVFSSLNLNYTPVTVDNSQSECSVEMVVDDVNDSSEEVPELEQDQLENEEPTATQNRIRRSYFNFLWAGSKKK